MNQSRQQKEFSDFGITGKLRAGILIGFLSVSLLANVYMYIDFKNVREDYEERSEKREDILLDKLLRQVEPQIEQIQNNVEITKVKVDTLTNKIEDNAK